MVGKTAFSSDAGAIDPYRVSSGIEGFVDFLEEQVYPLKESEGIDYPLVRDAVIEAYNRNTCEFETLPDIDHPLKAYAQPVAKACGYNYWEVVTKQFFLDYPEAHKITGETLTSIREMTIAEFTELKEVMNTHYELKKKYPDTLERLLIEFRELATIQIEGLINAGHYKPRERKNRHSS